MHGPFQNFVGRFLPPQNSRNQRWGTLFQKNHLLAEVNISPKINISSRPLKMALHGTPGTPCPWIVIFLHGPKKGNFSAHGSNISARTPQKSVFFYAQLNKKLAKSALYHIIHCFACFSMI